jgi:hypothetical protein
MKKSILFLALILSMLLLKPVTAHAQVKTDVLGKWNVEAPSAPQEYQTSVMQITKDSVFTTFPGYDQKFVSTFLKFQNDTLIYNISGLEVVCTVTMDGKTKMKGNATWEEGESVMTLTKIDEKSKK